MVAEVHDPPGADREDREQLTVQLYAGELLAGVVADAEHDVVAACNQLERVDLWALLGRGPQPGKDLVATLRLALEGEDLRGGGSRATSGSLPSARHQERIVAPSAPH